MQVYELDNNGRTTRFTGERVAHSTSRGHTVDRDALRWTDVDVYRTESGRYVLHKVGLSRVYCREEDASDTSRRLNVGELIRTRASVFQDMAPCPVCRPGPLFLMDYAYAEGPRGSVTVSDTAAGLVESAHSQDADGVRFITKTAAHALDVLSRTDEDVREAWRVDVVL